MSEIEEILKKMYPDSDTSLWSEEIKKQIVQALETGKVPEPDDGIPDDDRETIDTNAFIADFQKILNRNQGCRG